MLSRRTSSSALVGALFLALLFLFYLLSRDWRIDPSAESVTQLSTQLHVGLRPPGSSEATHEPKWEFKVERDAKNFGLSEEQCLGAFGKLFTEIDKSVALRAEKKITLEELDSRKMEGGMGRVVIDQGELFIVDFLEREDQQSRARATINALQRALVSFPDRHLLPSIEFIFGQDDGPTVPEEGAIWAYTKRDVELHNRTWIMPEFGYWSWPEALTGTYGEVRRRIAAVDTIPFKEKVDELVWRGFARNYLTRHHLLNVSAGHSWADIHEFRFDDPGSADKYIPIEDHCRYKYLAHTEGNTYSGRAKYLFNCHSVSVSHPLKWREPHHAVMVSHGPDTNYIEVEEDFSDLPEKMDFLLANPEVAQRIADNSVKTFRDRYLTPAAEACYWRQLIRSYAGVSEFKPARRGAPFEDWTLQIEKMR